MRIFFIFSFTLIALLVFFRGASKEEHVRAKAFHRVIALAPSYCETVVALGQAQRLIGVTTDCENEETRHSTRVGSFAETNLEVILSLKPDLVLAVPHALAEENLKQLQQRGVSVFAHQPDRLDDIKFITMTVAKLLDVEGLGIKLNQNLASALTRVQTQTYSGSLTPPTILLAIAHSPLVVAGFPTYMSEIATMMGYKNLATHPHIPWPIWSPEHLLTNPPHLLVILEGKRAFTAYQRLFANLHFDLLKAGTKLVVPHYPLFFSPSPKLIADIEYFFQLLNERV